jgi:hypothetical protein
MKIAFELIACWVALSCIASPFLTWAFFRGERFVRDSAEPADIAPNLSVV